MSLKPHLSPNANQTADSGPPTPQGPGFNLSSAPSVPSPMASLSPAATMSPLALGGLGGMGGTSATGGIELMFAQILAAVERSVSISSSFTLARARLGLGLGAYMLTTVFVISPFLLLLNVFNFLFIDLYNPVTPGMLANPNYPEPSNISTVQRSNRLLLIILDLFHIYLALVL